MYKQYIGQACTQKVGMGVVIQLIVDPRRGGLGAQPPATVALIVDPRRRGVGAQPPATVAYLIKDSPENPVLAHTAIKCNYLRMQ